MPAVELAKPLIISLLATRPGQPRKGLYQHSAPLSLKWGYLRDRDTPIITFEDQDIRRLFTQGVLEFVEGDRGRRCAVLTKPHSASAVTAEADATTTPEAFAGQLEARDQQIRRLLVGDGPSFEELLHVDGTIGGGTPYRFDELPPNDGAAVPPLVFIHIPRTAGTTLNKVLMRNYKYRADSYGANFFPPYPPSQFLSLVKPPQTADERITPAFFTGHIDLSNDIFRYMPVRYIAITVLRDPVDRIVSHYRFNSTQPSIFQDAIRHHGLDVVGYLKHFGAAVPLQYQLFAPASDAGEDERAAQALRNLATSLSLFGLQEDFGGFMSMLSRLVGLPDVSHKQLNKLPAGGAVVTSEQTEQLRALLKQDIDFYQGAAKLYREHLELMEKRAAPKPHPWTPFYA